LRQAFALGKAAFFLQEKESGTDKVKKKEVDRYRGEGGALHARGESMVIQAQKTLATANPGRRDITEPVVGRQRDFIK